MTPSDPAERLRSTAKAVLDSSRSRRGDAAVVSAAALDDLWQVLNETAHPSPLGAEGGAHPRFTALDYALHTPRCRDCADEDGHCPATGLPCEVPAARKVVQGILDHLAYGIAHGYCENPFAASPPPASAIPPDEDALVAGESLAGHLYDAFWARTKFPNPTPFSGQALAIKAMWKDIAGDALFALSHHSPPSVEEVAWVIMDKITFDAAGSLVLVNEASVVEAARAILALPAKRTPTLEEDFDPGLPVTASRDDLVRRGDVVDMLARLTNEAADYVLTGEPDNARIREGHEAALTRAKHAMVFMPAAKRPPTAEQIELLLIRAATSHQPWGETAAKVLALLDGAI